MLKSIEAYLVTNGNGQEAVAFYQEALGAKLEQLNLYKDFMPDVPAELAEFVMNAQLSVNGIRIMLSDNNPSMPYIEGNNIAVALIFDDVASATEVYGKLSKEARKIEMELQTVPWSPAYANVTDKFGINWQINAEVSGYGSEYYAEQA